jgi:hypothetical protein
MRFMMICKPADTRKLEAGGPPSPEEIRQMHDAPGFAR